MEHSIAHKQKALYIKFVPLSGGGMEIHMSKRMHRDVYVSIGMLVFCIVFIMIAVRLPSGARTLPMAMLPFYGSDEPADPIWRPKEVTPCRC